MYEVIKIQRNIKINAYMQINVNVLKCKHTFNLPMKA